MKSYNGQMSTHPASDLSGQDDLEMSIQDQLERAKPWENTERPVIEDLTDEQEAEFVASVTS